MNREPRLGNSVPAADARIRREQVMVPMRDGVRLATDIYFPPDFDGRAAVLLERTPYGKRGTNHGDRSLADSEPLSKPQIAKLFATAGYVFVIQDCRGRYGSEGEFVKYLSEGPDGADTLAWLVAQPWCNGLVGTLGLSYGAHVQTALAAYAPPGLAAMFLDSGGFSSAYHSGIRQGGALELKQLTWALKHARLAPATARDPARRAALDEIDIREWISVTPWTTGNSPLAAAPEYEAYVIDQWSREIFSEFWRQPSLYARGHYDQFPDVPMVHMSSWFDPYALTATENFAGLARIKRAPIKLVLGPWTHGQRSVPYAGDVDFGPAAPLDGNIAPDYVELRKAWFDRYMRDLPAPDYLSEPVTIFTMGGGSGRKTAEGRLDHGGQWRSAPAWPLPEADPTPFFLAQSGQLRRQPPREPGVLSYDFDPTNPVPTIGGALASGSPLMEAGAFDQRERNDCFGCRQPGRAIAERDDVLVFDTEPLDTDQEVTGPIEAVLFVSSSALDTDVTIKVVDIYPPSEDYPQGYAMNLSHGILRLRFRNSFEAPELLEPGVIYEVRIQAFPTSNLFAAGHRIRLEVSSSNFPHFDINPNTGAGAGVVCDPVVARNSIHCSLEYPSRIILPLVPGC